MSHARLNLAEATKAWILRECGWKVRDIGKRFDVDPRRLYEVWEEVDHSGSRLRAIELYRRLFPDGTVDGRFEPHSQKFRRTPIRSDEPMLPGF